MSDVFIIVRLNVTLASIKDLKLTLNHQVRFWLLEWVNFLFISTIGIEMDLVVITACNGRDFFSVKVHGGRLSALTTL